MHADDVAKWKIICDEWGGKSALNHVIFGIC